MARRYRRVKRRKNSDTSWKSLRRRFKVKKRLRRFGLALFVLLSVLLTLGAIYAWHFFTRPFAQAAGTFATNFSWDGKTPLNLLWLEVEKIEDETAPLAYLAVLSLNPTSGRFTVFALPLEYRVYLSSQGKHPLKAVYGVGNSLDPKQGIALAAKNVSYILGIPIDGYLLVGSEGLYQLGVLFGEAKSLKDYFSIKNITHLPRLVALGHKYLQTDLSLSELGRIIYFIWGVRADKVKAFNLDPEFVLDQEALDKLVGPLVKDENFAGERLKIQILNGTLQSGLAAFATRLVRNMGGEVIRTGNYERQDLTKGFLVLDESGSYTARRLAYIFGVVDSRPPKSSVEKRADITVILGLENYKKIF